MIDETDIQSSIEKLWERQHRLDESLFKIRYDFKVLSFDVRNKQVNEIAQSAKSAAIEWVSNYTQEIVDDHVNDDHFYLNRRLDDIDRKLSEYNDFYSKIESLQTALDRASERIAALERIVIGGSE